MSADGLRMRLSWAELSGPPIFCWLVAVFGGAPVSGVHEVQVTCVTVLSGDGAEGGRAVRGRISRVSIFEQFCIMILRNITMIVFLLLEHMYTSNNDRKMNNEMGVRWMR